jgi:hypothetical protein
MLLLAVCVAFALKRKERAKLATTSLVQNRDGATYKKKRKE